MEMSSAVDNPVGTSTNDLGLLPNPPETTFSEESQVTIEIVAQ